VIPREGVERIRCLCNSANGTLPGVIPREGVESEQDREVCRFQQSVVIPREGVESKWFWRFGPRIDAVVVNVIPREGVESPAMIRTSGETWAKVIPREGVERL